MDVERIIDEEDNDSTPAAVVKASYQGFDGRREPWRTTIDDIMADPEMRLMVRVNQ